MDNVWYVHTPREGERATPAKVSFDVPIRAWPNTARLTSPEFEHDLVTAKLMVWLALEPAPVGWIKTASTVPGYHRTGLNFIRWKYHIGVEHNRDLRAAHHRDFVARYRRNGLEGMLDLKSKAEALVAANRANEIQLPLSDRGYFFHVGIEELLGVSLNQTSPEAIEILLNYANEKGFRFQKEPRKRLGPQSRNTRNVTAHKELSTWQTLANFNDYMQHDPIGYNPYSERGELEASLKGWACDVTPTPDAPPYQTSWLINAGLRFLFDDVVDIILDFAPVGAQDKSPLSNYKQYRLIRSRLKKLGFKSIANYYRRSRWAATPHGQLTVRELIFNMLAIACVVEISAFGARRQQELSALRPGCVTRDLFGDLWLHCFIAKNKRHLTKIPANKVVERAVHVLEKLATLASRYGESEWLLDYFDPYGPVDFKFNEALRLFADWVNVPLMPDGSTWLFTSHQFRKFFAVSYQWRYYYGDFRALNHHLRQSINVTAAYTRLRAAATLREYDTKRASLEKKSKRWIERDRGDALREEETSFISAVILSVLDGTEKLGGAKGRAMMVELEIAFSEQISISKTSGPSALNEGVRNLAKSFHMVPHPEGHGYCGCGFSLRDRETAGCLIEKAELTGTNASHEPGPDYEFAPDSVCATCVHNIRLRRLLPYWESAFAAAGDAARSPNPDVAEVGKTRSNFIKEVVFKELKYD
ncbi:hypothetical protein [Phyllobacterium lublinensis]|uniref:hypothetical protein n=1 Tax=Phyllobacterium lublinensis TaxID=2875708 RepID=UPI001CC9CC81|nr:hypothetical protein [Phyllobacterium sp. 2063]MBZ9657239.1 hypothetical protein [Phyllobacterium sp. 2063]